MTRTLTWLPAALLIAANALAVVPNQIDTFEDGTTQGWVAGSSARRIRPRPRTSRAAVPMALTTTICW